MSAEAIPRLTPKGVGVAGESPSLEVAPALTPLGSEDAAAATPKRRRRARATERAPLFSIGKTVKPAVVMSFSRQLSSFLEAGISLLDALEIVGTEISSPPMRKAIAEIATSIQRGSSFVDAVSAHPQIFPAYYRAMLMSAEYTGNLDEVLSQLAAYLDRDITARRQVKSALTYPIVVFVVAIAAMIVMSVFVLPKFSGLYRSLGAKLPLPTRMLLGFTDFVTTGWPIILGTVAAIVMLAGLTVGGDRGKSRRDVVVMHMPVLGNLFHLISLERFCRVLSALVSAGVPLPEGIGVAADSTNNTIFQSRMETVRATLVRGSGLFEPMVASDLFPVAARQMIQVGEKTGSLGEQLAKASAYYEREVSFSMKRATELFEPMVILCVGLIVGFVAVAQVAAMYSIFGQVK